MEKNNCLMKKKQSHGASPGEAGGEARHPLGPKWGREARRRRSIVSGEYPQLFFLITILVMTINTLWYIAEGPFIEVWVWFKLQTAFLMPTASVIKHLYSIAIHQNVPWQLHRWPAINKVYQCMLCEGGIYIDIMDCKNR